MAQEPRLCTSHHLKAIGSNSKDLPNCDYAGFIPINLLITTPTIFSFSCEYQTSHTADILSLRLSKHLITLQYILTLNRYENR